MQNNQTIVEKSLSAAYADSLSKEELIAFNRLQQSARKFLKNIQFIQKWDWHTKSIREAINVYYNYTQDTDFIRKCFLQIHEFQKQFNNFLGRKNFLTVVNEQGKILFFGEKKVKELYKEIYPNTIGSEEKGNKQGTGKAKYKNLPQAKESIKNFNNQLLNKMKKQVDLATKQRGVAYKLALFRLKRQDMHYKKQYSDLQSTLYWKTTNYHIGYTYIGEEEGKKGYNAGRVAETYAEAIINNRNNVNVTSLSIQEFIHYLSDHIDQDSIPALVKGDIVLNQNGAFHFSVKAENASTAAIQPYIGFAYYLALTKPISRDQLQLKMIRIFREKRTVANTILSDLLQVSTETLRRHLPQYQQLLLNVLS